jgi:hypothetical protein
VTVYKFRLLTHKPQQRHRQSSRPTTSELPQDGPHGRYSHAANLLAQLRLRGISVRFADEADDGYLYLRPYRNEHQSDGDEPVEVLFLAGPAVHDEVPEGYRRIAVSGGSPSVSLLMPTAVYVPTSP